MLFYTIILLIAACAYMYPKLTKEIYTKYILPILSTLYNALKWLVNIVYIRMVLFLRNYLMDVLTDKELNDKLNLTLKTQLDRLLLSEDLNKQLIETVKEDARRMSIDPEMNAYIHELIQLQLESSDTSQRTRAAIAKILKTQIEGMTKEEWFEKEVKEQITKIVVNTCESNEVKDKLRELLEKLSSDLIESGEINRKLNDLLTQIVNDENFLKSAGSGVRRSLRHAAYGMIWSDKSNEEKDSKSLPITNSKPDAKTENKVENKVETKTEKMERPAVDKLKVSIVSKARSNSTGTLTDSMQKQIIAAKGNTTEQEVSLPSSVKEKEKDSVKYELVCN